MINSAVRRRCMRCRFGTTHDFVILLEECAHFNLFTVHVPGGNQMIKVEAKRQHSRRVVSGAKNIRDSRIMYGSGSIKFPCSIVASEIANRIPGVE